MSEHGEQAGLSARLAAWISEYDGQGWHRTGSPADRRSSRWLTDLAHNAGATVVVSSFEFSRLIHRRSALRVGEVSIPGVPLYDARLPPPGGVRGRIGPVGSGTPIVALEATPGAGVDDALDRARQEDELRGIVAIMRGTTPGLALRNAHSLTPAGPPVLQVSNRYRGALLAAAEHRRPAELVMEARRVPGTGENVIAAVEGTAELRDEVVVLTPRTGWWQCAAERGGGLGCWLAALEELAARPAERPTRFVATAGHELGFAGLQAHLASQHRDERAIWVHLGANIGSAGGRLGVFSSDPAITERAVALLGGLSDEDLRPMTAAVGEASELARTGRSFVSFVGTNSRFHLPTDRYPANVDVPRLAGIATGLRVLVRELAGAQGLG